MLRAMVLWFSPPLGRLAASNPRLKTPLHLRLKLLPLHILLQIPPPVAMSLLPTHQKQLELLHYFALSLLRPLLHLH